MSSGVTLWHVRNVAAWLIVAGALAGIASLVFWGREAWRTYVAAAVAGFGIAVYSLVAIFAVPDLGSAAVVGTRVAAVASSSVDVGPFVCLLGGVLLLVGGIAASRDLN